MARKGELIADSLFRRSRDRDIIAVGDGIPVPVSFPYRVSFGRCGKVSSPPSVWLRQTSLLSEKEGIASIFSKIDVTEGSGEYRYLNLYKAARYTVAMIV